MDKTIRHKFNRYQKGVRVEGKHLDKITTLVEEDGGKKIYIDIVYAGTDVGLKYYAGPIERGPWVVECADAFIKGYEEAIIDYIEGRVK